MKLNRVITSLLIVGTSIHVLAQSKYPIEVENALKQTTNRPELEKALNHFYNTNDKMMISSINFLIANMPIHLSYNYYWVDEKQTRIPFDESKFASFKDAVTALENIKRKYGKIFPVPFSYRDIDSIKASSLIENVELACKSYNSNNNLGTSEKNFLEYILPYRTTIEPIENWRKVYTAKFAGLINNKTPLDSQVSSIGKNIRSWFTNTYKIETRNEPLPRLGALQLINRKKGACEDIANLAVFMARSQGYEATVDFVPAWATASGVHFLNYLKISPKVKPHYDAADGYVLDTLAREPGKVFRTTYSVQYETVAYQLHGDTSQIPNNFMRQQNYKDVTDEYWQTSNVNVSLFKSPFKQTVAYISVWNYARWVPVWFGNIQSDSRTTFSRMGKGAVYLPLYYKNGKMIPAGWPVINGYYSTQVLQPDLFNTHTIRLIEDSRYLAFRAGKKYKLFYWNSKWIPLGEQIAGNKTFELVFDKVPMNALLLLLPEYTQGKDRPFIISEKGERFWF